MSGVQIEGRDHMIDYPPPPHICTVKQLNEWLCNFVLEIRRKDGNEYPPNTLYSVCCGILRHVRSYLPEINFFNQPDFDAFRRTLDGEMKRLRSQGLGAKKKRAEALTIEDEDKLWEEGLLGATTPPSYTIRYYGLYVRTLLCSTKWKRASRPTIQSNKAGRI